MTAPRPDPLRVGPLEVGVVRLFALDMPAERARFLREPGAAAQVLGVEGLDDDEVAIFPIRDLGEMGLAGYLAEGFGIDPAQLEPDRAALETLEGWVMVVRSRAFGGRAVTLRPDPAVRPIGAWVEPGVDWSGGPLEAESAHMGSAPRKSPREARAQARMIGASVFTGVMAIIIAFVIWLALR